MYSYLGKTLFYAAGTPCDSFGPFTADKIPSSGEADAARLTTYEWFITLITLFPHKLSCVSNCIIIFVYII